jgi:hypothetical protein
MMSSYICMGVVLREEPAHDSVGGRQGGLVCSLGCWAIITGIYALSIPAPHCAVRCYTTNARGAPVLQVETDAVAPWLSGMCAPWHAHAARTGRAVVLLGGGVCLSGLVLSAPSFRPQLIPLPQTSVLTDSCLGLSLLRCLEACDTGEGRR